MWPVEAMYGAVFLVLGILCHAWPALGADGGPAGGQLAAVKPVTGGAVSYPTSCTAEDGERVRRRVPGPLPAGVPPFLQEYARFHRESLLKVAAHPGKDVGVRFLLFVCVPGKCGGMGDRLKGIVTALYLAVVSRRVLLIQHDQFPLTSSLEPHGIDWDTWARCLPPYDPRTSADAPSTISLFHPPFSYMTGGLSRRQGGTFEVDRLIADASRTGFPFFHFRINLPVWNEILDADAATRNMRQLGASVLEPLPPGASGGHAGPGWVAPPGPRFAWAWRVLFRLSDGMERELVAHKRAMGIPGPGQGAPWVGVHMRAGASDELQDAWNNPYFCKGPAAGAAMFASCARRVADRVTRPPFAGGNGSQGAVAGDGSKDGGRGGAAGPSQKQQARRTGEGVLLASNVPIFLASDNEQAVKAARDALVRDHGHNASAVGYTGVKAFHLDNLALISKLPTRPWAPAGTVRRLAQSERSLTSIRAVSWSGAVPDRLVKSLAEVKESGDVARVAMMTILELVLLSQATCVVRSGSGFVDVAHWLSRDLVTGDRCAVYMWQCGEEDLAALGRPRQGPPERDSPARLPYLGDRTMPVCSVFRRRGQLVCPTPLAVEAVYVATMERTNIRPESDWDASTLQAFLGQLFRTQACRVDITLGDRNATFFQRENLTRLALTLTVYAEGDAQQAAALLAFGQRAPQLRIALTTFLTNVVETKRVSVRREGQATAVDVDTSVFGAASTFGLPTWVAVVEPSSVGGGESKGGHDETGMHAGTAPKQPRASRDKAAQPGAPAEGAPLQDGDASAVSGKKATGAQRSGKKGGDGAGRKPLSPSGAFVATPGSSYCLLSDEQLHINTRAAPEVAVGDDAPPPEGAPLPNVPPSSSGGEGAGGEGGGSKQAPRWDQVVILFRRNQVRISAATPQAPGDRAPDVLGTVMVNQLVLPATRNARSILPGGMRVRRDRRNLVLIKVDRLLDMQVEVLPAGSWQQGGTPGDGILKIVIKEFQGKAAHGLLGQFLGRKPGSNPVWSTSRVNVAKVEGAAQQYLTSGAARADCHFSRFKPPRT